MASSVLHMLSARMAGVLGGQEEPQLPQQLDNCYQHCDSGNTPNHVL